MKLSPETKLFFGLENELYAPEKGVVPYYLEGKYKLIAAIENLRAEGFDIYETSGLFKCLISSDEEEVREVALRAICEGKLEVSLKKTALIIASFDSNEDVLTTALEEANSLDLEFAKELASRLTNHDEISVSEYAKGVLLRT